MALLFATLCKYELTAKHTRTQVRALRSRLSGEGAPIARQGRSAVPSLQTAGAMGAPSSAGPAV